MRARVRVLLLVCGLCLAMNQPAYAGSQAEEKLSDSVRVLLRQAVQAGLPNLRPFASREDESRFYRWRDVMGQRLQRYIPAALERETLLNAVDYEAHRAGLEPALVLGVMEVESRFKPTAHSHAGAIGLMQVMPFWAHSIGDGHVTRLYHARVNIRYGSVILRHYLDRENGDVVRALARYNGSLGQTTYAYSVLRASHKYK
ncbi:lytic transglycosylase domain-containing protein [Hydromonas duriensis]|uniref:Transglycosylase-like protein with SLT domain n=1 Tax=Hydromonas duriensis TaxID=1527608 RepID=A0A4R6Y984_9BURK|nr:lytic transglycosylase domain-containing protein [Hydromonas duriensis]TDR32014.1 transglycosylase-like protein with SLT domain [Hydromonas duriensis]